MFPIYHREPGQHSRLTPSQKRTLVRLALKYESASERRKFLEREAPADFCIPLPLKKFNRWVSFYNSEGRQCSYGCEVDYLLANSVWDRVDKKQSVNLDVVRQLLRQILIVEEKTRVLSNFDYGSSWAASFARRHKLPSFIYSVASTQFSTAQKRSWDG
jgi:hypothetical protein